MGIGVSIFLIALGAILTFATNFRVSGVDLHMVGIILMIVGAIGLVVYLVVWAPRRRRDAGTVVDEQRRVYDDRPPM
jgi:Trk-type K+ transport system membrane component